MHRILALFSVLVPVLASSGPAFSWGAISFDEIQGTTEACVGHDNEFNANTCSLAHCQGRCVVVASFRNACAAVSVDRGGSPVAGFGDTEAAAEVDSLERCSARSGDECIVDRVVCE